MMQSVYADFSNLIGVNGYYSIVSRWLLLLQLQSYWWNIRGILCLENSVGCDYYRNVYIWGSHGRSKTYRLTSAIDVNSDGSTDYDVGFARTCLRLDQVMHTSDRGYIRYGSNRLGIESKHMVVTVNIFTFPIITL